MREVVKLPDTIALDNTPLDKIALDITSLDSIARTTLHFTPLQWNMMLCSAQNSVHFLGIQRVQSEKCNLQELTVRTVWSALLYLNIWMHCTMICTAALGSVIST